MKQPQVLSGLTLMVPRWRALAVAGTILLLVASLGIFFYVRGRSVMQSQLKDRLRDTAAAAALQFPGEALDAVPSKANPRSIPVKRLAQQLRSLRLALPDVRFAYLMRKTKDQHQLEFVADADLVSSPKELDKNGNGKVDDDEAAALPGDRYDISDAPAMQGPAFESAAVDDEITVDRWGGTLSGYAPIRRRDGTVAGILGLDMSALRYQELGNSIFSPVALLLVLLSGSFIAAYMLVYIQRRRFEMLEHVEQERSALLHLTFHQMGTPLTEFKWSLDGLKEARGKPGFDAVLDEHMTDLQDGITRMDGIVDMLREADEVHAGTLAYAPELTSLDGIVREMTAELKTRLEREKIMLELDLAADLSVNVDGKLIAGVLRELLGNAITYSEAGTTVTVRTRCDGKEARVQVSDHGCGIPTADADRIFREFSRGGNAATHNPDGVGLGLYIAKGVIEKAGGGMGFTSVEGKGSTFTFWLPVA